MSADAISDFLAEQRDEAPEELQGMIIEFETLWERKLWHQLTNLLIQFFQHERSGPQRLPFFKVFVLKFADKINQLKLVDLALKAATQIETFDERLAFMQAVAKKVDTDASQDAFVFATIAVARVKLDMQEPDAARKDLDIAERVLDSFDSVENIVHSSFYDANAEYYRLKEDFGGYYRNALLYLACIDINSLSDKQRLSRAYHLSMAALASHSIYNFGELLLHPILDALKKDPDNQWVVELLFAFNRGDLDTFNSLIPKIKENPILSEQPRHLRQKIYLSALMEAVFRRPPHDRTIYFKTIEAETQVKPSEVEHLIMKALSLGLLRGTIDQVDQVAHITWVQPKVLDMQQIDNMRKRLKEWDSNVNELGNWIEKVGRDVW